MGREVEGGLGSERQLGKGGADRLGLEEVAFSMQGPLGRLVAAEPQMVAGSS